MKLGRILLVLSAGLVSGLMMVAVASGSQAHVTQKALEAPHPSGATKKAAVVGQVACASTQSCAATGTSLYTELTGKWKATGTPVVPGTGGTGPTSLACPAAGRCEAVGIGGENHLVHVTENGRKWSIGELPLPANAVPIDPPTGPFPHATLSCAGAGDCTAVGSYFAADHTTHALLYGESNGTWGAPADVPLPPDASTMFPPPDGVVFAGGALNLVSCPSPGNCSAVGSYTREPNGAVYPWRFDEVGGQWVAATTGLQLPAGASTVIDDRAGGASPFMGFSGLSCPSAGNCTAIGGYVESQPDFQGVIFTERDGVWSNGMKAPAPAGAAHYNDPMELINPLNAVSCATANDCAAVGSFLKGNSETQHGLLLAEHQGKWKATAISLPRGANARGGVYLSSVSCPSAGNCVAVGDYAAHGKTHGVVVRERGGKWLRAVNAALPKGAAPASRSHTFLISVTCPSKSACEVGGSYSDRSGKRQGLLLALKLK